jgi:hypothetical protein
MSNAPTSLVRPSSLNYKISLSEAVNDFVKKEMPVQDDQFIDVLTEDPKFSPNTQGAGSGKSGNNGSGADHNLEDFDDVLFDMTAPTNTAGGRSGNNKNNKNTGLPQTPLNSQQNPGVYINE